ncbi:glutaredoxin family protein [Agrococcus sediminis]|uniref:Glutaredoxin family protein n=1 Tax=Agrococcus sediminis TaxID=2599924 RepID=A0A5M8QN23_9MICO|nr:glutaredoxin family protein [Agrococcus sediminis]
MSTEDRPVVWTRPGCPKCVQTKKAFVRQGIEPKEVLLDDEQRAKFYEQGLRTLPVVEWRGKRWEGFQLDLIRATATAAVAEASAPAA